MLRVLFKFAALVGLIALVSVYGPEIHRGYIRGHVGDRTAMLIGVRAGGSGFRVEAPSGKTYIMTNRHVCETGLHGAIGVVDAGSEALAFKKIIKMSDQYDLCLVEATPGPSGLDIASFVRVGETIGLVGHPRLQPLTVSTGELIGYRNIKLATKANPTKEQCRYGKIVKARPNIFGIKTLCVKTFWSGQITAYSRGGSSGSPVVNFYGNVVGVLFAGDRMDQFQSFIVPLESVQDFLKEF